MDTRRGFTLIELVVVVVVLAILSVVAIPRYVNASTKAKTSAESAIVGGVQAGLTQQRLNAALNGTSQWPAALDSVAAGAGASPSSPFFSAILEFPVTSGWTKGSTATTYIGPTGTTYYYDPTTGTFGTTPSSAVATGGTPTTPTAPTSLLTMSSWIAGSAAMTSYVGAGYTMIGNEIQLADNGPFAEASRRVVLEGEQAIQAGDYTVHLDTQLTNYDNQLNYWMVIGIKDGTQLNLSGNTLQWGSNTPGTKTLFQDYAPPEKSDGSWYGYDGTFTVSAADAAAYDKIVVVMAGTKNNGQILGWKDVTLTKK